MEIIRPAPVNDSTLEASSVPETPPTAYSGGTTYALNDTASIFAGTVATVYRSLAGGNIANAPASSPLSWEEIGTTYKVYDAGTTYDLGDVVISVATHREYESLVGSNLGQALTDETKWLDRGNDNRWRMFDQSNSSQTIVPEEIDVSVSVLGRADSVSLLNIVAATVQITSTTVADGLVYDQTFDLVSDSGVTNWYDYFFEPIIRVGDLVVTDLPVYADPTIRVIMLEPGGDAECGTLTIGQSFYIGGTEYGARVGIADYSRKVINEFGDWSVVERSFSKKATFKIMVANERVDAIAAFLATIRATPVVFKGTIGFTSSWIFGFYKDWGIEITYTNNSYCTLEIEGLT